MALVKNPARVPETLHRFDAVGTAGVRPLGGPNPMPQKVKTSGTYRSKDGKDSFYLREGADWPDHLMLDETPTAVDRGPVDVEAEEVKAAKEELAARAIGGAPENKMDAVPPQKKAGG